MSIHVSNKSKNIIFVCLIAALLVSIVMTDKYSTKDNTGYAINLYQNFSPTINSFSSPNLLNFSTAENSKSVAFNLSDDAIYKTAYISINGTDWQPITLTGTVLSGNWLQSQSAGTATISRASIPNGTGTDNYLIIYSCTKNISGISTTWNCHNNKWQIKTFNTTKRDAINNTQTPQMNNVSTIYAINCGGPAYTVTDGTIYQADQYYDNVNTCTDYYAWPDIIGTVDDELYRSLRCGQNSGDYTTGTVAYNLPVQNGNYNITLKFSEIWFGTNRTTDNTLRQMNIFIEGSQVLSNLEVRTAAGGALIAYDKTFQTTVIDGMLNIRLEGVTHGPQISAILVRGINQSIIIATPNCSDNKQNQGETGVDCGGPCAACAITCSPESDTTFCNRLGKNCNSVTAKDNCNTSRTVNCGSCNSNQACTSNVCIDNVVTPICGDGSCNGAETCSSCAADCGSCSTNYLRTFYVSNAGNDGNTGTSESAAWQTISKVNAQTFKAGDAILFRRGDRWNETLNVKTSGSASAPITYSAYGSGSKPVITGFKTITGWTNEGNGIYSKVISVESQPRMATLDGAQYWMGRWPDTGWMSIDSTSGSTQISDSSLDTIHNWVGAEVVIRKNRWIIDRDPITSQSGNTLTFSSTSGYNPRSGWGYFIQNNLGTLTRYGEWYYNSGTNKFYMYFGSEVPTNHVVEVSTLDRGIYVGSYSYITIDGISIRGENVYSIYGYNAPNYITIQNCDISFSGTEGIYMEYPAHCTVKNTNINNTNNNAILFAEGESSYNTISHNNITNTGTIPGAGKTGDENYNAIKSVGSYGLIEYNNVITTGYLGINYGGTNTMVRNNFVNTVCYLKDDGGGIYTYADKNAGKQVLNNIVINSLGAPNGSDGSLRSAANGMYADGFSAHILLSGNTIYNVTAAGMYMNPSTDIAIVNNKFYQMPTFFAIQRWPGSGIISGLNISNDVFMSTLIDSSDLKAIDYTLDQDGQTVALYNNNIVQEVNHLGYIDNNYYYTNKEGTMSVYVSSPNSINQQYSFSSWVSTFGHDTNSYVYTSLNNANVFFDYNPTTTNKIVTLNGNYVDAKGTTYSGSVTIQPFTSLLLTKI